MPKAPEDEPTAQLQAIRIDGLGWNLPEPSGVLKGRRRPLRSLLWLVAVMAVLAVILSLQSIVRGFTSNTTVILTMAFVTVILAYGAYGLLIRWGERRTVSELALGALPQELVLGIAIGVAVMSTVIGILWLIGVYEISVGTWTDWPHDIRETLGTGLLEELLARLVIFRLLVSAFRVKPALILSAALFGAAHFFNPAASVFSTISIAVEAGLTFAGFYLLTGRIWVSVGAHAGWNFAQGAIFGARVSGMPSDGSLLVTAPQAGAPLWLSGGSFGPEASLVAVAIGLAVFLFTMRRTRANASVETDLHRTG